MLENKDFRWLWGSRQLLVPGQLILWAGQIGIVREQKEQSTVVDLTEDESVSIFQTVDLLNPVARVLVFSDAGDVLVQNNKGTTVYPSSTEDVPA